MSDFAYEPFLVVVSAPSGTGKTTVCHEAIAQLGNIRFSVSHTTRNKREYEVDGKHYHFVSDQEFEAIQRKNGFLEWANVYGNMYGTSIDEIERARRDGKDLLVEIDVQGAHQIMARVKQPPVVSIFILPPSMAVLERRLRGRDTDAEADIQRRLAEAKAELVEAKQYDYWIVNEDLNHAAASLVAIVRAERLRRTRAVAQAHPLSGALG